MAITFSFECKYTLKSRREIKTWVKQIIESRGKKLGSISYIFCDDEYLLQINKQYLCHDYYTDIITFDYTEGDTVSGDMFISVERVEDNARQMGLPKQEELMRVVIHGILHLLGLKDKTEREAKQMRKAESECLEILRQMHKNE